MSTTVEARTEPVERDEARWRRPLVIGLVADAVGVAFLLLLVGEVIPPLIVFGAIFVGMAVATARTSRRWPQVVTIIASVIFVGGNLPFLIEDLSHPESMAGFGPGWLLLLATLYVLVAAVMVYRRSDAPVRGAAAVAIALAVIGLAGSAVASAGVEGDTRRADDVVVVAKDVEYPDEVRAPAGRALFVENHDIFRHTFVVDDTDVKHEIPASTDRRIELDLPPGAYAFRCDVPGHEAMEGTLIVP